MMRLLNTAIFSTVAVMLLLIIYTYGPIIEGIYFPVTENTQIQKRIPLDEGKTELWGVSKKIRPECSYAKLEWWYGNPNGNKVLIPSLIEEKAKIRGGGWFEWGPWVVKLDPLLVKNESFAVVYHSCHPFWLTETLFYVGDKYEAK